MIRSLRLKMSLGFALLLGVFAASSAYLLEVTRRVDQAVVEVRAAEEAVRNSLGLAGAVREQYNHVAHVLLLPDGQRHLGHLDGAVRLFDHHMGHLRRIAAERPDLRARLEGIAAANERYLDLLRNEILPAHRRGEQEVALARHADCEQQLAEILTEVEPVSAAFLAAATGTQARAERLASRAVRVGAAVLLGASALALLLGVWLWRAVSRPIAVLVRGTHEVAAGRRDRPIELATGDEFDALAESFNDMTERLREREAALVRAEKTASLGRLAAGVAHQLNNPIGVMLGYLRVLESPRFSPDKREEAVRVLREELQECRATVLSVMALARPGRLALEEVDAGALLAGALAKARRYVPLEAAGVSVRLEGAAAPGPTADRPAAGAGAAHAAGLPLTTDPSKLEQALLNLMKNAAEAMAGTGGGELRLAAERRADGAVALTVSDTGPGMEAGELERIFDAYYTTKPDGSGLGLALAQSLVEALGGRIEAESRPGRGSTFRVILPGQPAAARGEG